MIHDLVREQPADRLPADVCIVGAGPAGVVLALELLAQGKRVTLLEADAEEAGTAPWQGEVLEFNARDFEPRQTVAESGWPFAKSTLIPYYARALELEGLEKIVRSDTAVWRSTGMTPPSFEGFEPFFARVCPEPDLAYAHRDTLARDPDLHLWRHANVCELILESHAAASVRARTLTGNEASFSANTFVFCLDAIESCRFFLQPRPDGLSWNRSGLLGKHLQSPINVEAATIVPAHERRFCTAFDTIASHGFGYHPRFRLAPAFQDQKRTLNCAASTRFLSAVRDAPISRSPWLRLVQAFRSRLRRRASNAPAVAVRLRVHCERQPDTESSITLAGERDSLGLFRARVDWKLSDRELATISTCVLQAQTSLASIAAVSPDPSLAAGDPAFRLLTAVQSNPTGGMRMTASAEDGLVDLNLRLHGTANCYVCSGAVFPAASFADCTHTVLALAVRLADHLRDSAIL